MDRHDWLVPFVGLYVLPSPKRKPWMGLNIRLISLFLCNRVGRGKKVEQHLPHLEPKRYPRMGLETRAAQFAPLPPSPVIRRYWLKQPIIRNWIPFWTNNSAMNWTGRSTNCSSNWRNIRWYSSRFSKKTGESPEETIGKWKGLSSGLMIRRRYLRWVTDSA